MDWLTFFLQPSKRCWPGQSPLSSLFVLKRQIAAVFVGLGDRLATIKVPGFEATFTQRMNKVEETLPAPLAVELSTTLDPKQLETRSESSKLPPAYVISHAWLRLQQTLYEAVETVHPGAGADGNQDLLAYLMSLDCTRCCSLMRNLSSTSCWCSETRQCTMAIQPLHRPMHCAITTSRKR